MTMLGSQSAAPKETISPDNLIKTLKKLQFTCAAVLGLAMLAAVPAQGQTFSTLHGFTGSPDGANPIGGLSRDSAGNLYGTTWMGGDQNVGTVFEVDSQGTETVLYSFKGKRLSDPQGVIEGTNGNFYGTTQDGGTYQFGTIFKVTKTGKHSVLHSFKGYPTDGAYPSAGLIRDAAGNLYGTTHAGGSGGNCTGYYQGCGTVFMLSNAGIETVLHSFIGGTDGAQPHTSLVQDAAGNLYGTTAAGGNANNCGAPGCGTVFMVSNTGVETVLYRFNGYPTDGQIPRAGLVLDQKGYLYGTTQNGGASGFGTVFKLNRAGKETVLHSFNSGHRPDGEYPSAALVRDAAGNLFGTTTYGPDTGCSGSGCGTVFKVTKTGKETVLYSFTGGADGAVPDAGLILDPAGNLYGITPQAGASGVGNVFKLTP